MACTRISVEGQKIEFLSRVPQTEVRGELTKYLKK
jgi:hypothetical protein